VIRSVPIFFAEVADVGIDGPGLYVVAHLPDLGQDPGRAIQPSRGADEEQQQSSSFFASFISLPR